MRALGRKAIWIGTKANNLRALLKTCCLKMPADFQDGEPADFPFREEKENGNTDRSRGFLPVLWPERRLAGSDSEVFRSALILSFVDFQNSFYGNFEKTSV